MRVGSPLRFWPACPEGRRFMHAVLSFTFVLLWFCASAQTTSSYCSNYQSTPLITSVFVDHFVFAWCLVPFRPFNILALIFVWGTHRRQTSCTTPRRARSPLWRQQGSNSGTQEQAGDEKTRTVATNWLKSNGRPTDWPSRSGVVHKESRKGKKKTLKVVGSRKV